MSQKKFLTSADISAEFGLSEEVLQQLVDAGELKALADRGTWKYRRDELEALITSGRLNATPELPAVDDIEFDETIGFGGEQSTDDRVDFLELDEEALSDGSTVISTGGVEAADDLKLSFTEDPTAPSASESSISDVQVFEAGASTGSDSDIAFLDATGLSEEIPPPQSSSDVEVAGDFSASGDSSAKFSSALDRPPADSGSGDVVALSNESSTLEDEESAESILSDDQLSSSTGDSGITFESTDSGLTLDVGDSGLTLETGDSGLTLDTGDSGLTLETGDSGLSLELVPDDMAPAPTVAGTQRMEELQGADDDLDFESGSDDSGGTRRLSMEEQFAEEHSFADESGDDGTAVIMLDDEEEVGADSGTLSGAFPADGSVEELEISDDLAGVIADDDEEFLSAEDAVLDVEDESFSDEFSGAEDDESFLEPAAKAAPREPSWGAFTSLMVIAAGGLVGTNIWLMWEGVSTMWNGSEPSGPAATLISSIAGILG